MEYVDEPTMAPPATSPVDVPMVEPPPEALAVAPATVVTRQTAMKVLWAISFAHMLNDIIQSLLPAIYPLLKQTHALSFAQIGMITFTFQVTASLLQPVVGMVTDRRPKPYSLTIGMGLTLIGLLLLSQAHTLSMIMGAAALVGTGSSVFHPEASRMAHMAAGGKHGLAQSLFQVGGNFGSSLGPLLAAWIVVPGSQASIAWFSIAAVAAMIVLSRVGAWYQTELRGRLTSAPKAKKHHATGLSRERTRWSIAILIVLVISKYIYLVSLTNYYTFYLIEKFDVSIRQSQMYLFLFLFAVAAGTFAGGPLGDHFGRKIVIWFSILGVAPFALLLPHVGLTATVVLSVFIGVILASAFSAILVFAQELIPGRVGTVAGLFFGFAFGVSGIASAALGELADQTSIEYVFQLCAYMPLAGLLAGFLPRLEK